MCTYKCAHVPVCMYERMFSYKRWKHAKSKEVSRGGGRGGGQRIGPSDALFI
jgi:hypothetical protein